MSDPVDAGPAGSGGGPGVRPDWLESTKHTRRRMPRVAIASGTGKKRNPWLVGALVWVGVAVVISAIVLGVHLYQERERVTMPETLAGVARATDPVLVAEAQAQRDSMGVDPKVEGSRFASIAYGTAERNGLVTVVPMGYVWAESDLAVIADENPDLLFGPPSGVGDVHCTTGSSGSGAAFTWCFRSGPDFSVLVRTGPVGDEPLAVLMTREAYAAQH